MVAERPPKDRRKVIVLWSENQEVVAVCGRHVQCVDSQVLRYCGKEGTKNPHRRIEEGVPPGDRREVTEGLSTDSAALSLPPEMPNMCHN